MAIETQDALLVVEGLTVSFRTQCAETSAVGNASFKIFPREIVGLLGESGSGKTTLGSAIVGLLPPEGHIAGGSISFMGRELVGLSDREFQKIRGVAISTIFQEPRIALNPVMRVGKQIAEVVRAHSSVPSSERKDTVLSILNDVRLDVTKVYDAYPHELSGGQCQRVAIAQALVTKPRLVIADEPTSSLDSTVQAEILELLATLKERLNVAFLLITHNPAILAKFASRVLVMQAGQIVEQGEAAEVLAHPSHPYTKSLLQSRGRLLRSVTVRS